MQNTDHEVPGYLDPHHGWLPSGPEDQSCAICSSAPVEWLHPLNSATGFHREYGKGQTLPSFWTLCLSCESLYRAGDNAALVAVMQRSGHWFCANDEDVEERIRKPLNVFRRSDLGGRRL